MDIYCRKCGEPWDMDTLHDEISERIAIGDLAPLPERDIRKHTSPEYKRYLQVYDGYYRRVREEFYSKGCKALYAFTGGTASWCVPKVSPQGSAMGAMIDIMGDDLDGIASMMDDADALGMFR